MERDSFLEKALTKEQRDRLSRLLGEISQFSSRDVHSPRYEEWWERLGNLARQVRLNLDHRLSDAEWDALTRELFIAWEETGIRKTHLLVSAHNVRKRVDRPSAVESTRAALYGELRSGPRRVGGPTDSPFS